MMAVERASLAVSATYIPRHFGRAVCHWIITVHGVGCLFSFACWLAAVGKRGKIQHEHVLFIGAVLADFFLGSAGEVRVIYSS